MELREPDDLATGFDSIFCLKCGGAPKVTVEPTVVYPRNRSGQVRYRYPCTNHPACLESLDLTHEDLRALYRQIQASEFGVHLKHMRLVRDRFAKEANEAPEARERIAAARELAKFTRFALEDAGIVDRKPQMIPVSGAPAMKVIEGSIVERKLKERVEARMALEVHREVEKYEREQDEVAVPEPEEVEAPSGL